MVAIIRQKVNEWLRPIVNEIRWEAFFEGFSAGVSKSGSSTDVGVVDKVKGRLRAHGAEKQTGDKVAGGS